jgi:hypothetical protein
MAAEEALDMSFKAFLFTENIGSLSGIDSCSNTIEKGGHCTYMSMILSKRTASLTCRILPKFTQNKNCIDSYFGWTFDICTRLLLLHNEVDLELMDKE